MAQRKPLSKLAVQVSPWAAVSILILLTWSGLMFGLPLALFATALLLASLVIHEFGHMAVAALHRVPVSAIGISAIGTYIRRKRARSRWAESAISLAGPLASFALAAVFGLANGNVYHWLAEMNLILAISNLVPMLGTDGDRALNAICAPSWAA